MSTPAPPRPGAAEKELEWDRLRAYVSADGGPLALIEVASRSQAEQVAEAITATLGPGQTLEVFRVDGPGDWAAALQWLSALRHAADANPLLLILAAYPAQPDEAQERDLWRWMDAQREAWHPARGKLAFILTPTQVDRLARFAQALWDWIPLKFNLLRRPGEEPGTGAGATPPPLPVASLGFRNPAEAQALLPALREQLLRARSEGLPEARLRHDYAWPLFRGLLAAQEIAEAQGLLLADLQGFAPELPPPERAGWLMGLGYFHLFVADLDGARGDYEAALPLFREVRDRLGEANCRMSLGDLKTRVADLDGARADYEAALPLFREVRDRLGEANCRKSLGDLKTRVADLDGARADYEAALPLFREVRDRLGEANCLKSLGDLKTRVDDLDGARADYEAALPLFREVRSRLGEAYCLMMLAVLKTRVADLDGARADYEAALPLFREVRSRLGEANCLKSLGDLKTRVADLDGARADYEAALPLFREVRSRLGEANCRMSLGDLKTRVADLDGARGDYEAALPLFREVRDRLGEANCRKSLGDLKTRVADVDGARADYEAALPLFREVRDRLGQANCLRSMGNLALVEKRLEDAAGLYGSALAIHRDVQDRLGEASTLGQMGMLYQAQGRDREATEAFGRTLELSRAINEPTYVPMTLRNICLSAARLPDPALLRRTADELLQLALARGAQEHLQTLDWLLRRCWPAARVKGEGAAAEAFKALAQAYDALRQSVPEADRERRALADLAILAFQAVGLKV
ncbi:MAG: tetratricopeptide repeat protein [Planctomycetes bacterium]|nr:tetratricopeptide repeat protein [Planctomycetota bacterium]